MVESQMQATDIDPALSPADGDPTSEFKLDRRPWSPPVHVFAGLVGLELSGKAVTIIVASPASGCGCFWSVVAGAINLLAGLLRFERHSACSF
jgi:hypothetical protein